MLFYMHVIVVLLKLLVLVLILLVTINGLAISNCNHCVIVDAGVAHVPGRMFTRVHFSWCPTTSPTVIASLEAL